MAMELQQIVQPINFIKISAMLRTICFLLLTLVVVSCQTVQPQNEENTVLEEAPAVRYKPSSLQKLQWLAGIWKGEESGNTIRWSFQFHNDQMLEVICSKENGEMDACTFSWYQGSYYYGADRRWVVTWIGEKDIRFDPVQSDDSPMTWTRLNDRQWHIIRHTPAGDKATLMERTDEMQP